MLPSLNKGFVVVVGGEVATFGGRGGRYFRGEGRSLLSGGRGGHYFWGEGRSLLSGGGEFVTFG